MGEFFLRPDFPRTRFYAVKPHPEYANLSADLSVAEHLSLTLLIILLRHAAGDLRPIDASGIRSVELTKRVLFDGGELAPICVFYCMSDDGSTAYIVEVERSGVDEVQISTADLVDTLHTTLTELLDRALA